MLSLTLAAMAIAYLDRICISTAAPAIRADLGLSDAQMGYVFSAFTLAYALFEVPAGWLADRFGARAMLTRIVVWWSAMTAATGAATGFASLVAVRGLFGMGEAGVLPSMTRAYAHWLPFRERGRAFGLTIMAAALGGAATQPLVVALLERVSWRHAFPVFGSAGLVWAAVWLWWFRDDPREHAGVNAAELAVIGSGSGSELESAAGFGYESGSGSGSAVGPESEPRTGARCESGGEAAHTGVPWAAMLRSPGLRALCAMYFGAIYGWYFYLTWLPTYLLRARGFDLHAVGWLAALPLLAIAAGSLGGGAVSDLLARRFGARAGLRAPGLVGLPLAALAVLGAIATSDPRTAAYLLACAAGLAALGVAPAWAVCLSIGGRHAGVVSGAMNTFGNLGGMLSPVVVGGSLTAWGSWEAPLYSVAALYLAAAACWLGIDPAAPLDVTAPAAGRAAA